MTPDMISTLVMLVLMVAVFYFVGIRPENKRKKQLQAMIDAIQVGDDILTNSGIYGTVTRIKTVNEKERRFFIESSKQDKTVLEIASWAVADVLKYVEDK